MFFRMTLRCPCKLIWKTLCLYCVVISFSSFFFPLCLLTVNSIWCFTTCLLRNTVSPAALHSQLASEVSNFEYSENSHLICEYVEEQKL